MKKRILCYGDSNTWGFIAGEYRRFDEEIRWTKQLQQLLGEEYEVIEEGMNGRTSAFDIPGRPYMNGLRSLGPILLSQAPLDLVILMLGTNDLIRLSSMEKVAKGMDKLVKRVKNADNSYRNVSNGIFSNGPLILLIAPTPFDPVVDTMPDAEEFGKYQESLGFNAAYKKIAEKYGCYFLDAADSALISKVDGVHFTEKGHKAFAEAIYKALKEIL